MMGSIPETRQRLRFPEPGNCQKEDKALELYQSGNYAIPVSFNYRGTQLKFKAFLYFESEFEFSKIGHIDAVRTLKLDINRIWRCNSVVFEPESEGTTTCKINGKEHKIQIKVEMNKWNEVALFPCETRFRVTMSAKACQKVVAELEDSVKHWHFENIYTLRKLHFDEFIKRNSKELENYLVKIEEIKTILKVDTDGN